MPSWSRVATRSRVPLGFIFAAAYFWLARPTWTSLGAGFAVAAVGVLVRALASGHIRKNAELATTGPYAYTRNPLYLGSIIIAIGFIIAARNLWIGIGALAMFAFIPARTQETPPRAQWLRRRSRQTAFCSPVPRYLTWVFDVVLCRCSLRSGRHSTS